MSPFPLLFLLVGILLPGLLAAEPPPDEDEASPLGQPAPAFELPGTGETFLPAAAAARTPLALVFYGHDQAPGTPVILEACRGALPRVEPLGARLGVVGCDDQESHEALLELRPQPFPLFSDAGGALQRDLGLDACSAGVAVIDRQRVLLHTAAFDCTDAMAVERALQAVLSLLRDLEPLADPSFVAVLGPPLSGLQDLVTLPDGRVVVLAGGQLTFLLGSGADRLEAPGVQAICRDAHGNLFAARDGDVLLYQPLEHELAVHAAATPDRTEPIRRLVATAGGALLLLHGEALGALQPATLRLVPLEGVETTGVVALGPAPDGSVTVVRSRKPYLQVVTPGAPPRVITTADTALPAPPRAATLDDAGRLYVLLRGDALVHRLGGSGKIVASFVPAGGGIEGLPVALAAGAGYVDVAVKTDGGTRMLRFAP
jgi:peroxiredoxin